MGLFQLGANRGLHRRQPILSRFQDGLDAFEAGGSGVREGFPAGTLQPLRGIAVRQFQQGHTGLVALLLYLIGREKEPYHGSGVLADLLRPADETLAIAGRPGGPAAYGTPPCCTGWDGHGDAGERQSGFRQRRSPR